MDWINWYCCVMITKRSYAIYAPLEYQTDCFGRSFVIWYPQKIWCRIWTLFGDDFEYSLIDKERSRFPVIWCGNSGPWFQTGQCTEKRRNINLWRWLRSSSPNFRKPLSHSLHISSLFVSDSSFSRPKACLQRLAPWFWWCHAQNRCSWEVAVLADRSWKNLGQI